VKLATGLTSIRSTTAHARNIVLMDITMPRWKGRGRRAHRAPHAERASDGHPPASVGYQENILARWQKGAKHFVQQPVKTGSPLWILR